MVRQLIALIVLVFGTMTAQAASQLYYIHTDHLGTPQVVTDSNQAVVWEGRQMPFGELHSQQGAITQPLRFPGQYADQETGFHYNYFRDYDPTLGRYIQSDPIGLNGGINTFGYALQNPLLFVDPNGLNPAAGGAVLALCVRFPSACLAGAGALSCSLTNSCSPVAKEEFPRPGRLPGTTEHRGELDTPTSTPAPPDQDPQNCAEEAANNYENCLSNCSSSADEEACRQRLIIDLADCIERGDGGPNLPNDDGPYFEGSDDLGIF